VITSMPAATTSTIGILTNISTPTALMPSTRRDEPGSRGTATIVGHGRYRRAHAAAATRELSGFVKPSGNTSTALLHGTHNEPGHESGDIGAGQLNPVARPPCRSRGLRRPDSRSWSPRPYATRRVMVALRECAVCRTVACVVGVAGRGGVRESPLRTRSFPGSAPCRRTETRLSLGRTSGPAQRSGVNPLGRRVQ
jgi:hypothetical protein